MVANFASLLFMMCIIVPMSDVAVFRFLVSGLVLHENCACMGVLVEVLSLVNTFSGHSFTNGAMADIN